MAWHRTSGFPKKNRGGSNGPDRPFSIDRDKVDSIVIKNTENRIQLRKHANNVWHLEEPVKDRADIAVLAQLFTTVETLRADSVINGQDPSSKAQFKEFGLSNSETRIQFGGERNVELVLGKDTAVEGKIYSKIEGANIAYVIPSDIRTQISRKVDEFRDRRLTELATSQVDRLVIKTAAGEIELKKKNDRWTLLKPLNARGDSSRIGDLISQTTTARIESFVADAANLATYGLQEPRGSFSFYTEGAKDPVVLQIGNNPAEEKDKAKTYAKLSNRDSVVLLPKAIEDLLNTKPNDLRDRNLVVFESDIVDRVTIEAGKEKLVLARNGEDWVRKASKDVPINGAAANTLLNLLKNQTVTAFVADVATDLPKFGLDHPSLKVTLSSFASENTAETKAGDRPIVSIHFGKVEGDQVYAKLEDEPFVVSVSKTFLDSIPVNPIQWQPLVVQKLKPEEITSLEITRPNQPPITLERDKDKWKLAKGDGNVNQVNAQTLVNTLSALRVVRWIGPVTPDLGLAEPDVTVSFKTANGGGKLLVSTLRNPAAGAPASLTGFEGAFEISRPDREALLLPLVDKAAANPPAAQGTQPAAAPASPDTAPQTP